MTAPPDNRSDALHADGGADHHSPPSDAADPPGLKPRGRRRFVWVVLAAAAVGLLAFPAGVWAAEAFTDVADDNVHQDAVTAVRDAGVTVGCAEGRYCPDEPVRRDQMASFMDRLGALSPGQEAVVNAATAEQADTAEQAANAGGVGGVDAQELLDRVEALEEREPDEVDSELADRVDALEAELADATARIESLEADNAELQATLAGVTRSDVDGHDTLRLEGMNLQVVNGTDSTDGAPNGLGNLVIGYNDPRSGTDPATDRGGSHYLVVGDRHHWTGFGGLLAGLRNTASGDWASVTGGFGNAASGTAASAAGGSGNAASGDRASVSGGRDGIASGSNAAVSGGSANTASGSNAAVSGGFANTASSGQASVSGGASNTASSAGTSVSGGGYNTASGFRSSILGGFQITVDTQDDCYPAGC